MIEDRKCVGLTACLLQPHMNINTVHLTFVYNISHDTSLIWFSDRILDSIQFPYFYYISKSHSTIKV